MKEMLKKKLQEKMKNSEGFTLLEILVVLTIMGFLIAMVAPRLAGISDGAVDTVCDSNQSRMLQLTSAWFQQKNRYPDKMTNLVDQVAGATFQVPAVSDGNPDNGPESLADEFMKRNHFRIHYLNADEAKELKDLGLANVLNLNAYTAYNDAGSAFKTDTGGVSYNGTITGPTEVALSNTATKLPPMQQRLLNSGVGVLMIGTGAPGAALGQVFPALPMERGWGENDGIGRMVFGFGPESELAKSGITAGAGHCPGGIQNADNVTYNDYNIVMPRLEATETRMLLPTDGANMLLMDGDNAKDGIQLNTVSYDKAPAADYNMVTNLDTLKIRLVDMGVNEKFEFATMCPEGHKFPTDDGEFWGIDINPTAGLGGPSASVLNN